MTRAEALCARALPLLDAMVGTGVPMKLVQEVNLVRAELRAMIEEASTTPDQPTVVNVHLPAAPLAPVAGEPGLLVETCGQCGGTGQVELPKRYLGERTRQVAECDACGGAGKVAILPSGRVARVDRAEVEVADAGLLAELRARVGNLEGGKLCDACRLPADDLKVAYPDEGTKEAWRCCPECRARQAAGEDLKAVRQTAEQIRARGVSVSALSRRREFVSDGE